MMLRGAAGGGRGGWGSEKDGGRGALRIEKAAVAGRRPGGAGEAWEAGGHPYASMRGLPRSHSSRVLASSVMTTLTELESVPAQNWAGHQLAPTPLACGGCPRWVGLRVRGHGSRLWVTRRGWSARGTAAPSP